MIQKEKNDVTKRNRPLSISLVNYIVISFAGVSLRARHRVN